MGVPSRSKTPRGLGGQRTTNDIRLVHLGQKRGADADVLAQFLAPTLLTEGVKETGERSMRGIDDPRARHLPV